MQFLFRAAAVASIVLLSGCASVQYEISERVFDKHKRDILVDRVEDTRDAQQDAQVQFQDALERFGTVMTVEETELKKAYKQLNDEYEDSVDAAEEVSDEIEDVEQVAEALFDEWAEENTTYTDAALRSNSEGQLRDTKARYTDMLKAMKDAEASMEPVLSTMHDNVLYLKHNLNAQAIGSLQTTFSELEGDIEVLIMRMNQSIERSNEFISQMQ